MMTNDPHEGIKAVGALGSFGEEEVGVQFRKKNEVGRKKRNFVSSRMVYLSAEGSEFLSNCDRCSSARG